MISSQLPLIVFAVLFLTGCIDFRMTDEDVLSGFDEYDKKPSFSNLIIKDRPIHYAYINQGKETLIIFIHGSPGSWSDFIEFFKADSLLEAMDIAAVDRPGFGHSGFGKAETSLEKQAYLLNEALSQFSHQKKILIGHSLGGPVIARMAMDYPMEYDGLIFLAPSIDPDLEKKEWYRKAIKTKVGGFFTPKAFEVSNDEILTLRSELEKMIPYWGRIRIPSIVIQGTKDRLVPKENADFARKMLADTLVEVRMLKGVDHFIPWTNEEEIIMAIRHLTDSH